MFCPQNKLDVNIGNCTLKCAKMDNVILALCPSENTFIIEQVEGNGVNVMVTPKNIWNLQVMVDECHHCKSMPCYTTLSHDYQQC